VADMACAIIRAPMRVAIFAFLKTGGRHGRAFIER
jgi:hypothetical protein